MLVLFAVTVSAQNIVNVSGQVTDQTGESIIGVSISIKGTSEGTITDMDGNYHISVPSDAILVFSFIGFDTQEVQVNNRSIISVSLVESMTGLDEVVVVGYGTQKVKDLTSSIVTVKADEITKSASGQTMQALQGKVAGVQIVSAGAPGSEPTVRIRGLGSYPGIGGSTPLYVVDGMYFDDIDFLNPSDIESLSVLKDASASSIYGVRAANGVVLITTKSGSLKSKASISYDGYVGVQVAQNVLQMANAEQFVEYVNQVGDPADLQFVENAMQRFGRSRINPNVPDVNTDWYKEIMNTSATQQNHALSVTGGSEKTAYAMGLSYFEQDGLLKGKNSFERLNIRGKLDQNVNKWLKAGVNVNVSNATKYIADDAAWFKAYHAVPILPVYDQENYDALVAAGTNFPSAYSNAKLLGYRDTQNPFLDLEYRDHRMDIRKVLTGLYAEMSLLPEKLKFKTSYNISLIHLSDRNVGLPYYLSASEDVNRELSTISKYRSLYFNQFWDNTLTYNDTFGGHHISAMVGTAYRDEFYDTLSGSAEDIPLEENAWYIGQSLSQDSKSIADGASRYYGFSYFGRLAYNYNSKYIAYATLRREGTSKYQEKWGTFPAIGAGWVISEESFFKENIGFVNYFKLRAGWGKLGNDKIPSQAGANTTSPQFLAIDDQKVNGTVTTSTFGYLGWETVKGTNVGISTQLFNMRLGIEADYYVRDTENAAIPVSLLLQGGSVTRNVGVIRNSGFEVAANWRGTIGEDLKYTIGANVATLKNEVRDLFGQTYLNGGSAEFRQRSQVGEPLLSFYGYEIAGVYQNQAEIDADPIAVANGLVPGDLKFKDQDGSEVLDDDDKVFLGSYLPKLTYGGSLGLFYKKLEFSMSISGQGGNKILNRKRGEIKWTNDTNIDANYASNLWNGEGTSNKYPSAAGLRRGWNQEFSDLLLEDGSFFRIQNIQLAYNIDGKKWLGENMPNARIYFTAERPLTVFSYNGFNPEVSDGIDRQFYPVASVYTLGLNIKF